MAAAFAHRCRERFLGPPELVDQPPIAFRLFQSVQVLALDVLDERELKGLPVVEAVDDHRDFVKPRSLRRTPAPFAGDDLIRGALFRVGAHEHRLHHPAAADRIRQAVELPVVETAPRLERPRRHVGDGDDARAATVASRALAIERAETAAQTAGAHARAPAFARKSASPCSSRCRSSLTSAI